MSTVPTTLRVLRPLPQIDPAELLDQVTAFLSRFSVFPDQHCAPMLTLWYAHTHAIQHFYTTPRLILDSAEPGSGKTRVLEVGQFLVAKPEMTISITTAAIFRMLAVGPVTLLFDEIDAVFSSKTGGNHEDLRALLNAGYKRSATVARCVGDASRMKVERFPVFAPVALAGIAGGMPATITTRAITVHMRRRAPHEHAEPFRERKVEKEAEPLRDQLADWLDRVGADQLAGAEPVMPDGIADRAAEVWEPLIAIADEAGGHWPVTAREAARYFVSNATNSSSSIGTRLLADMRELFLAAGADRMETADILAQLIDSEESSWGDIDGRPLDARRLAREMSRYNVRPKDLKLPSGSVRKGYRTDGPDGLADVWLRYLPQAATSATGATSQVSPMEARQQVADTSATRGLDRPAPPCRAGSESTPQPAGEADQVAAVAAAPVPSKVRKTRLTRPVAAVAAVAAVADVEGGGDDA